MGQGILSWDGNAMVASCTAVKNIQHGDYIFHIQFPGDKGDYSIRIFSLEGEEIFDHEILFNGEEQIINVDGEVFVPVTDLIEMFDEMVGMNLTFSQEKAASPLN